MRSLTIKSLIMSLAIYLVSISVPVLPAQAELLISTEAGVTVVRGDVEMTTRRVDTSRHGVSMTLPEDFRGVAFDKPLLLIDGTFVRRDRRVYSGRKCRC